MDHATEKLASPDAILAIVQDVFRAELEDNDLNVGLDTRQEELKAWDSLAHIRLVSALESEFDIQFTLEEIEQTNSIRKFVNAIAQHLT